MALPNIMTLYTGVVNNRNSTGTPTSLIGRGELKVLQPKDMMMMSWMARMVMTTISMEHVTSHQQTGVVHLLITKGNLQGSMIMYDTTHRILAKQSSFRTGEMMVP